MRIKFAPVRVALSALVLLAACSRSPSGAPPPPPPPDAGSSVPDSGPDVVPDAGQSVQDAGPADAGAVDAGPTDAGTGTDQALTNWVNPFIGTETGAPDYGLGNEGAHLFPGAVLPFGMVQFSPDTTIGAGGYRYEENTIHGFSTVHFSGRGINCYQEFSVMPTVGTVPISPGTNWNQYSSTYSHANEQARPGYYAVTLDAHGVLAELTATTRTGMARFTFPANDPDGGARAQLLISSGGAAANPNLTGTGITVGNNGEVYGQAVGGNCGGAFTYTLYYVARFDQPFVAHGVWNGDTLTRDGDSTSGTQSGAYLSFDTSASTSSVVNMKFGLSWVSVDQARKNLDAENPGWDFAGVKTEADSAWNSVLNRIQVQGNTDADQTIFYTALYHAQIHPSTFSDVDGSYIGFDNLVHTGATGRTQYHNFPGWDNYRSQMRLLPIIAPDRIGDMMQSLVNDAQQDPGGGLPRWEHANANSGGMVGDSQDVVLAGAYAFGVRDFDAVAAFSAIDRGASTVGTTCSGHLVREGLDEYLNNGYVAEDNSGSASLTMEYANDDFAASRLASALGETTKAATYLQRSHNWTNLFDSTLGYVVPHLSDGSEEANFSPTNGTGFVEGDGAQYVWLVPYDVSGLAQRMGGLSQAAARLDDHVSQLNAGPGSNNLFMGNEPEEGVPWIYDWLGEPYRTQEVVRSIWLTLYGTQPGDYPGNDDGGALSSWVVFAALGLYPAIPGVAGFAVGSPLFPEAVVSLPKGGHLRIHGHAAADNAPYVQSLQLNGTDYPSPWIDWSQLEDGAELDFQLGTQPNTSWGSDPGNAPPSFE
jgi:predicted alpha-1,2-mannosidase